ncbi:MAG: hypothetical protein OHK0046_51450 [Anaerolineae bacterium]
MNIPDWREREFKKGDIQQAGRLSGALLFLGIGVWIGARLFAGDAPLIDDTGYYTNIFTEILSVILTIGVLNYLAERREDKRREREDKARLVREAGSPVNATAVNAVRELRERDWLEGEDSALKGARLHLANLSAANLSFANLSATNLSFANLSAANLSFANLNKTDFDTTNLSGADLKLANLSGASLYEANLSGADLELANLSGTFLLRTNLSGAILYRANLSEAILYEANLEHAHIDVSDEVDSEGNPIRTLFDEHTTLPDGSKWTPDVDWSKFGAFTDRPAYDAWRESQEAQSGGGES